MRSQRLLFALAAGSLLALTVSSNPDVRAETARASGASSKSGQMLGGQALQPTSEELRFVEMANQERQKRGLGPLTIDPLLVSFSRDHSAEMRDRGYFNHHSPTPGIKTPMDRYLRAVAPRPEYACVGENLFYCSLVDVKRGHEAFMTSPAHRENVLFPRFEKIGVGVVKNEKGEFWVTQLFLPNSDQTQFARKAAARP